MYLRTAIDVGQEGWANFGHVKMPDYRWGIFLAEPEPDRRIAFGDHMGEPVWQEVPGEYRADLRRLLVVQGDTEPASVEQQRRLCLTAPSLYDLRNLFQVNVEEGRHLWAMVYLLHRYFGRDGRDEADEMLERHSGDVDHPRILGAFNEPTPDWLSFFFFTYFTDRDGKFQLASLRESGVRPAVADLRLHAEGGGPPHVRRRHRRRPRRAAHRRADEGARHRRRRPVRRHRRRHAAALPELPLQRVARPVRRRDVDQRRQLLRRRAQGPLPGGATRRRPPAAATPRATVPDGRRRRRSATREAPALAALNETLRDDYVADCQKGVDRWNRTLAEVGARAAPARTSGSTAPSARSRATTSAPTAGCVDDDDVGGVASTAGCRPTTTGPTSSR